MLQSDGRNKLISMWPELAREIDFAEKYLDEDPESALVKLRRFGECLVLLAYDYLGLPSPKYNVRQIDLLSDETFSYAVGVDVVDSLHLLRRKGNIGAHRTTVVKNSEVAAHCLKTAKILAQWWLSFASKEGYPEPEIPKTNNAKKRVSQSDPNPHLSKKSADGVREVLDVEQEDRVRTREYLLDESQAGYCGSLGEFSTATRSDIIDVLQDKFETVGESQIRAWRNTLTVLQPAISSLLQSYPKAGEECSLVLEYTIPLESRRIDALLLFYGVVVVLEFKGKTYAKKSYLDQTAAYARDLRAYHRACSKVLVKSLLVLTREDSEIEFSRVGSVDVVRSDQLFNYIERNIGSGGEAVRLDHMLDFECYLPLPSLIKAARELFNSHNLPRIHRAAAKTEPALEYCAKVIRETAAKKRRALILICGVPGAGKTLVGLQLAHGEYYEYHGSANDSESEAVFLSGNGPLVEVLQYELKAAGGGGKAFVRGVHDYVKTYTRRGHVSVPHHILIYDEAQRAFDAAQVRAKHKMMPQEFAGLSEPELFVQFAERAPEWCVVVGLIGTGQEIHIGEEGGIVQWREAIENTQFSGDWDIHIPPYADVREAFSGLRNTLEVEQLELGTTIRFHLATKLYDFVENFLEGQVESSQKISKELKNEGFNLLMTHELELAKQYLRECYSENPDARYGMVTSSKDRELTAWGVEKGFKSKGEIRPGKYGRWYAEPQGSPESCTSLSTVVTEFGAQGLELDAVLLAWGSDFIRENGCWTNRYAAGYRDKHRVKDPQLLRKNTYRVLLTRGRDCCVVYIPPIPQKMRETYSYMKSCGFDVLV